MAEKLGVVLKNIQIPDAILAQLQESLSRDQDQLVDNATAQRNSLEQRLARFNDGWIRHTKTN